MFSNFNAFNRCGGGVCRRWFSFLCACSLLKGFGVGNRCVGDGNGDEDGDEDESVDGDEDGNGNGDEDGSGVGYGDEDGSVDGDEDGDESEGHNVTLVVECRGL